MARANAAYYATHDPYADFTTSPEVTQVFGELLGAWAAVVWDRMGRPGRVHLVECGPGRGTLMADALRTIGTVAAPFRAALSVHLIEASPRLRALQATALPGAGWHDRIEDVPPGPMILLANEFLDALPIRQFVRRDGAWAERFVEDGALVDRPADPRPTDQDGVHEVNEAACAIVAHVARRVSQDGGAALFLDYGPSQSRPGDSLQALRSGRPADPLADPGTADLTAHVDFGALAR
ncbi:MAG: SAM-dependent methyltransferase, partial [Gemmatimonadaceae bacterium]|nr:SAM-dependent methyltransferase [Acetobacteraceae bacterium]